MIPLPKLLIFYASMGINWQFLESGLMMPTLLRSKKAFKALTLNPFDVDLQIHFAKICYDKQAIDNYATQGAQIKACLH